MYRGVPKNILRRLKRKIERCVRVKGAVDVSDGYLWGCEWRPKPPSHPDVFRFFSPTNF